MRQVLRAGALGRPRRMGWGGRQEGGSGWGTHVNPWLIHVNVWQKPLQYCKLINLQLIKINGKKKRLSLVTQFVTVISLFYCSIANSSISSFSNGYALFCLSHTPSLLLTSPLHSHTFFVMLLHSQSPFSLFYHQPTSPTTARDRHLSQGGLSFYRRLGHRVIAPRGWPQG